jgi:hypothetical protein
MKFVVGPEESSDTMHGVPMKSHASWDGNILVVSSVAMFGTKPLRLNDRWDLSDDGMTLPLCSGISSTPIPQGESTGANPVTCWTCHRGSAKPQSSPQH